MCRACGIDPAAGWHEALGRQRRVGAVDDVGDLGSMERWLVDELFPALSNDSVLLLAGRPPLSAPVGVAPAWAACFTALALRNFDRREAGDFLSQRGVPAPVHDAIHRMAHGHPLALALFAEVARQAESEQAGLDAMSRASLDDFPDVVQTLLSALVRAVPTDERRLALRVCAITHVTTEELLRERWGASS